MTYKDEQDAAAFWRKVKETIAAAVKTALHTESGIVPDVAYSQVKFNKAGVAYWGNPAGSTATNILASASRAGTDTVSNPSTIVDYDTVDYDPDSRITTGSSWQCAITQIGWYQVFASLAVNKSSGFDYMQEGEYWDLVTYDVDNAVELKVMARWIFHNITAAGNVSPTWLIGSSPPMHVTSVPFNLAASFNYNNSGSFTRDISTGTITIISLGV